MKLRIPPANVMGAHLRRLLSRRCEICREVIGANVEFVELPDAKSPYARSVFHSGDCPTIEREDGRLE